MSALMLAMYDQDREVKISPSTSYGLGGVLLQICTGGKRGIWACERFTHFLIAKHFHLKLTTSYCWVSLGLRH